jgi:hypothetical protein
MFRSKANDKLERLKEEAIVTYCNVHNMVKIRTQYILNIEDVPGGKVNILGGHSIGHSKEKILYVHVSYSERFLRRELFHCTFPKTLIRKRYHVLFLISVLIVQVMKFIQFS